MNTVQILIKIQNRSINIDTFVGEFKPEFHVSKRYLNFRHSWIK